MSQNKSEFLQFPSPFCLENLSGYVVYTPPSPKKAKRPGKPTPHASIDSPSSVISNLNHAHYVQEPLTAIHRQGVDKYEWWGPCSDLSEAFHEVMYEQIGIVLWSGCAHLRK